MSIIEPSLKRFAAAASARMLICLAAVGLCSPVTPTSADPATRSLPGTVTVTLQPDAAVAAGAQWALEDAARHASGDSSTNLLAGTHSLQFIDVPGWAKPDAIDLLVIGGKTATVTASYRPLPHFYFRDAPAQRVPVGKTLELFLDTDNPGDPENPGPGIALAMTATPAPAGALQFDPGTGHLAYTPVAADRLPFTLRFVTPAGLTGTCEVTPENSLVAEEAVIEYDRPLPDAESREYMNITQVQNAPDVFNDATNTTYSVTISGQTLVFEVDHPAYLHRQFSGRLDLRDLQLYADKVIIRSPLLLPQTHVSIRARELRFEADGRIDTTPRPRAKTPDAAVAEDHLFVGRNGDPGHDGGNLEALVESFFSDGNTTERFVLRGGAGGHAGEGRDGRNEGDHPEAWADIMLRAGNPSCGQSQDGYPLLFLQDIFQGRPTRTCGAEVIAFGENAVPAGTPGVGGRGGTLRSTLDLAAFAQNAGGAPGAQGSSYVGGTLLDHYFYEYRTTIVRNEIEYVETDDVPAAIGPGRDAAAPAGTGGASGTFQVETNAAAWLHPFALRSVIQFARDAYLNGRIGETRRLLADYRDLLRAHERVVGPDESLSDEDFSVKVNLDQLQTEVENTLYRIDSNLDYFGNPAGWVPMLSFEANYLAFQTEIEQSIPILYLAYWLNNAATNLQASLAATEQAKSSLEQERTRMENAFNEAQAAIPRLQAQAQAIAFQIGTIRGNMDTKLSELEARARQNVEDRHKVPLWKKALGVLSVAADLIPIGQPTVGRIGAGLGLLAQIDTDKPLESAKALAPQAMSVMTNRDISVCFGSNAPPAVGAGTNTTKKGLQDRVRQATDCAKFLGAEYNEISGVFKSAQVDDKELAGEIEKLKASDTELQSLAAQVEGLNAQKTQFAQELAVSLQVVGSFTSQLAQNLVATHELTDRIAAGLNLLDHGALLHIKEMERRARDRLTQFQYLMIKSYQYRKLKPYSGNLQLTSLLTRFQQLIEANTSHLLSEQEFNNLKGIFISELRDVVSASLDNVNAPRRSLPKSYSLSADQLRQLNEEGSLVLNFRDLGLIDAGDENVRLADLHTRVLTVHPVGGPIGSLGLTRVNFQHRGVSRLTTGGRTYLFRHYQTEAVNPIVWNVIFDANTGQTANSTLSAADQSLIGVLLASQPVPVTNLLLFSQPAVDAEFLLTKSLASDNGTDFVIDALNFEIQYDFSPTSGNQINLKVRVSDNLKPVILVSQNDLNQRGDGLGNFVRVFAALTPVTLQAPGTYGQYVFDHWLVNSQPQSNGVPVLATQVSRDTQVEARYRLPAVGVRLLPLTAPAGQLGFRFVTAAGGHYTIEQSPRLDNPAWTTVDTRTGDGTPMDVVRPITGSSPAFFRVRQDP